MDQECNREVFVDTKRYKALNIESGLSDRYEESTDNWDNRICWFAFG